MTSWQGRVYLIGREVKMNLFAELKKIILTLGALTVSFAFSAAACWWLRWRSPRALGPSTWREDWTLLGISAVSLSSLLCCFEVAQFHSTSADTIAQMAKVGVVLNLIGVSGAAIGKGTGRPMLALSSLLGFGAWVLLLLLFAL
jgi:hypothetical protein